MVFAACKSPLLSLMTRPSPVDDDRQAASQLTFKTGPLGGNHLRELREGVASGRREEKPTTHELVSSDHPKSPNRCAKQGGEHNIPDLPSPFYREKWHARNSLA